MNGKKRLHLSRKKIIGGVCGGIAEFLNVDPSLVRVATALLTVLTFGKIPAAIIIIYVICWAVLPHANDSEE